MPSTGLVNSLNRIRELSSDIYHQYIPLLTEDSDISTFGQPILNYQAVQNEFMSALINRIAATQFEVKYFNNPLRVLEGDRVPFGHAVQDIAVNKIAGRKFDVEDFAGLLAKYEADVKVQYLEVNSDIQYPVTITKAKLQKAFLSWDNLNSFIDEITNEMYNSAYIDEYNQVRALVTEAYLNNRVQIETIDAISDTATAKYFTERARELFLNFQAPSSNYNAWSKVGGAGRPIITWTNPEDIVIIIKNSVRAKLDVDVLASAFNIDRAILLGNIISVPDFDIYNDDGTKHSDGSAIVGILCDKSFFKIREQDRDFSDFWNPNNRTWQLYLNIVKMYATSLFANAVVFATSAPTVDATAVTPAKTTVSVKAGEDVVVPVTLTPFQATTAVTASSSAEGKATVSVTGHNVTIHGVEAGNATVTVSAGAGVTATIAVTVTSA
ncbi:MAG: hypothetical protein IIW42_05655 [Bacteroidaceae bacterium]|nr:hypothetical protein [Bacteroidaceae bacterium]